MNYDDIGPERDDFATDEAYDDYYDSAKKDREPVIQGRHGGCIYRDEDEAALHPDHAWHSEAE